MKTRMPLSLLAVLSLMALACGPDQLAAQPADPAAEEEVEEVVLPKLDEMQLPTAEELMSGERRDWIVLSTDEVIVSEPIYPRPNTVETVKQRVDNPPKFQGERTPDALEEYRETIADLPYLNVTLPGGGAEPEYRLHIKHVQEIRHHEDLMLRRVDVLTTDGEFRKAFEMLFVLERRQPGWPGAKERRERLLFLEAKKLFEDDRLEAALVTLEELHAANPSYAGLKNQMGAVTDRLVTEAVAAADFRQARHFLLRLKRRAADHGIVEKWRKDLLERSAAAVRQAQERFAAGELAAAVDAAELAARIWPNVPGEPTAPNLTATFQRVANRYQRLRVGVVALPVPEDGGGLPSPADERRDYLTRTKLFEVAESDDAPHFRSRLFEQWEPTDLGRRVTFTLRQNRAGWESQPVVTATSLMSSFRARLDPASALYDERLAGFVSAASVVSPFEFEVRFRRVPARIESLLTFPVSHADANEIGSQSQSDGAAAVRLLSRRFVEAERTETQVVYRRAVPEPDDAERFHVAEIVEQLYPDYEEAIRGLMRGEVSMLPRVPSADIPLLKADDRLEVVETALPVTHLLQFNPQSRAAGSRELRRALAYALYREKILLETVLEDPKGTRGRIVSGPFPSRGIAADGRSVRGYAYNTRVEPRRYDPLLAASLSLAARKGLGGKIPELKLRCVDDPIARRAAQELVRHWGAVGLNVTLLTGEKDEPADDWDLVYRIVRLTDPVVQLWPLLTLEPTARVESLSFLPDWLRQELIELERAGDWKTAVSMLHDLHEHLARDALLIPLWELDDFIVYRKTIRGYPQPPLSPYQRIEQWTVKPWFAADVP